MIYKKTAKFTDSELEYIYWHLSLEGDIPPVYKRIEKKIRRQVKKYRDATNNPTGKKLILRKEEE